MFIGDIGGFLSFGAHSVAVLTERVWKYYLAFNSVERCKDWDWFFLKSLVEFWGEAKQAGVFLCL